MMITGEPLYEVQDLREILLLHPYLSKFKGRIMRPHNSISRSVKTLSSMVGEYRYSSIVVERGPYEHVSGATSQRAKIVKAEINKQQ
jgi:hypothetical protein